VQSAIDLVLSGITTLGEAMAVGSGLDELIEAAEPGAELAEPLVDRLLSTGA
jgi:hypothetical protein